MQPACTRACACHSAAAAWARRRNLVSHAMGDDIPPSARSRGVAKPEKPTQDTSARAECPVSATKAASSGTHSAQNAQVSQWRTRPIGWPSRRRNRLLWICLRFLTPAPYPPHARPDGNQLVSPFTAFDFAGLWRTLFQGISLVVKTPNSAGLLPDHGAKESVLEDNPRRGTVPEDNTRRGYVANACRPEPNPPHTQ